MDYEVFLQHLRELPFVRGARILREKPAAAGLRADALLEVRTPRGRQRFLVEQKRTHLTYAVAEGVLADRRRRGELPWMLFARYVGPRMGRHLADGGVAYVDVVGNCHVAIGEEYIARIEGRTQPKPPPGGRGVGAAGLKVVFALLARPALAGATAREVAAAAGVAPATVTHAFRRLENEQILGRDARGRRILDVRALRDQWLAGYTALLRPKLLRGRFEVRQADVDTLEAQLGGLLPERRWAWGGAAAAFRLLGHYRAPEVVLHVEKPPADLARRLRALPAREGRLILMDAPGPIAFEGAAPRTVHPLLVYTELMAAPDERARETAARIGEEYLWPPG